MNHTKFICILILFVLFSAGCETAANTGSVTQAIQATVPAATATETLVPPTSTATITPFQVKTPTITLIPTPSTNLNLGSTLTPNEKILKIKELLSSNGGCELPCWWGIVPGESTWIEAENLLSPIAIRVGNPYGNPFNNAYVAFEVPQDFTSSEYLEQSYVIKDDVIFLIEADTGNMPLYTLSEFFTKWGQPEEIRIGVWVEEYKEKYPFLYYLFYPQNGFIIRYIASTNITDEYVYGCPRNESDATLALWSNDGLTTINEILGKLTMMYIPPNFQNSALFPKLEDISDLNEEEFYKEFINSDSSYCIQTPRIAWPNILN